MSKRVLFFSRLFWPHGGGVETHVERLSKELVERGYQISLITEQYDPSLPLSDVHDGVQIFRIPYFALTSKRLVWQWMSQHGDLFEQADTIHIHDVFWWYWWEWLGRFYKPVYITFHGYEGSAPPTWKAVAQRKAAEFVSQGSICVGDFMRQWYLASPTMVTYGAANLKPLSICHSGGKAVFWGRYDVDTGCDVYAGAMALTSRIKALSMYGEGNLEKTLRQYPNVSLHSWTATIRSLLLNVQYAFVSRYLSILEAMQLKRLVVAAYNNRIKYDYLNCHPMRDNMIIVGSSSDLIDRLNSLPKEKEERMVEAAFCWAREQTWQKMADNYERLWQR